MTVSIVSKRFMFKNCCCTPNETCAAFKVLTSEGLTYDTSIPVSIYETEDEEQINAAILDAIAAMSESQVAGNCPFQAAITSDEEPGTGDNTLEEGQSRIWTNSQTGKTVLVHRVNSQYKCVELA